MKKLSFIHPFLFAVFPIFFLYAHNIDELSINVIFAPIAITICFTFLAWLLLRCILKETEKVGLLVSLFLLLFFSYGHFHEIFQRLTGGGIEIGRHRYFLLLWIMLYACGGYFIIKTRRSLHNLTAILGIGAASLVLISIIRIGVYEFKERVAPLDSRSMNIPSLQDADTEHLGELSAPHDIYYIIFDTYASLSTLKEYYNYDNSEFTDYLTDKGFYVAYESRCNYPTTYLSLASSLNMEYLNYLIDRVGEESTDKTVIYEMLQDYKVWRFLKSKGYKFIHFGSWWGPTRRNRYADVNYDSDILSYFSHALLYRTTMVRAFYDKFFFIKYHRNKVLDKFNKLARIPHIKEPKFVFAHMIIPHPPHVFDKNGEMPPRRVIEKRNEEDYLNQLIFVNKKIKQLIDEILSKSERPPIIILQADEGPFLTKSEEAERLSQDMLRKKIRIFNAYYMPGIDKKALYKSITPVNTFRLIFNLYFDTNFELLSDESYISGDKPYQFIDVTDIVKYD